MASLDDVITPDKPCAQPHSPLPAETGTLQISAFLTGATTLLASCGGAGGSAGTSTPPVTPAPAPNDAEAALGYLASELRRFPSAQTETPPS